MRFQGTILCLSAGLIAFAGDVESLHVGNANFDFSRRVTLQLHGRLRTNHDIHDFYQARGGPVLLIQQSPRLQWIAGYYYIGQETDARRAFDQHRVFGGGQVRLWQSNKMALDWRNTIERHFGGPSQDYTRYRTRMLYGGRAGSGWRPYAGVEGLLAKKIWTTRLSGGLQYLGQGGKQFSFGYEWRQYLVGPASHILTTAVQFPAWRARSMESPKASRDQGSSKTASTGK